jgi:integrase
VKGVEIRHDSIRLRFTVDGSLKVRTLKVDGVPMKPTQRNIKHAQRLAAEIRDKLRLGLFAIEDYFSDDGADTGSTVGARLDHWLASLRVERSTMAGYATIAAWWKGHIGAKPLRALVHSDILVALAGAPNLSGKTVNNRVSVLRKALQQAVLDKAITANPAEHIASAKHQKPLPDPFTIDEARAIIQRMHERYEPWVALYTAFRFFTGLRSGESMAVRWGSIDWRRKTLLVGDSIVLGHAKGTKTGVARTVRLNADALAALAAMKAHSFLAGEHVFPKLAEGGIGALDSRYLKPCWVPTLKALGIRYRQPYTTRHTYATMMLMSGARSAWCAKQMGHDIKVFLTDYARWLDGGHDDAELARVESFIGGGLLCISQVES